MKRSPEPQGQDNNSGDGDMTRQELLNVYFQQQKDIDALHVKQEETTSLVKRMAKEIIAENLGLISPFRDRFVKQLGTIVDFGISHSTLLLEAEDENDCYFFLWARTEDDTEDTIDVCACCTNPEDQYVPTERHVRKSLKDCIVHRFSLKSRTYLQQQCPSEECKCHVEMSELALLLTHIRLHAHSIVALMHEMKSLYAAFMNHPQKMLDTIADAQADHSHRLKKHKIVEEE